MLILIPKKFKLFGKTWKVSQPWKVYKDNRDGECNYQKSIIKLRRTLNKENKEITYLHEVLHAVYDAIGYPELRDNEELIDRQSKALHQVLTSEEE